MAPDGPPPPIDDAAYAAALDKLGTLITGRSRKDGHSWEWNHAMEVMQLCLEVRWEKAATFLWGSLSTSRPTLISQT